MMMSTLFDATFGSQNYQLCPELRMLVSVRSFFTLSKAIIVVLRAQSYVHMLQASLGSIYYYMLSKLHTTQV